MNSKQRRHSGWVIPHSTIIMNHKDKIKECLEPQPFYNDWINYRDGWRNPFDNSKKRKKYSYWMCNRENVRKYNNKIKRLSKRRTQKKCRRIFSSQ